VVDAFVAGYRGPHPGAPCGIRSRKGTAVSGDGTEYEYPDEAGYPDGTGTLDEGVEDAAAAAEDDVEAFAMEDEEDVTGD
jgi:hypothetical protein